jgi:perosamine synthetase
VLGCTPAEFGRALSAEGVPASVGYIGKPIYMSRALQEKATYGTSHCPYDCGRGRDIQYRESDCPNTVEILRTIITLGCNEFFTGKETSDIGAAISKVAGYYKRK